MPFIFGPGCKHDRLTSQGAIAGALWQNAGRSLFLFSILLQGCAPTGPVTTPVSGVVTLKGQPLTSGIVRFNPVDPQKGRPAEATLGQDGKFTMSTFKSGDGVIAGDYTVTIAATLENSEVLAKDKGTGIGGKSAIPDKYSNPKTSGLEETIETGKPRNDLEIELTE